MNTQSPAEIRTRILDIISEQGMIDRDKLIGSATLADLDIQSIDIVMILQEIEDVFDIYVPIDQSISDIETLDDLVHHIADLVANPPADPLAPAPAQGSEGP